MAIKHTESMYFLEMFKSGEITVLATSRILDEGVDVPDASIAIIMSSIVGARMIVGTFSMVIAYMPSIVLPAAVGNTIVPENIWFTQNGRTVTHSRILLK